MRRNMPHFAGKGSAAIAHDLIPLYAILYFSRAVNNEKHRSCHANYSRGAGLLTNTGYNMIHFGTSLYVGIKQVDQRATSLHGMIICLTATTGLLECSSRHWHVRQHYLNATLTRSSILYTQHARRSMSTSSEPAIACVFQRDSESTNDPTCCSRQFHHWTRVPETRCLDVSSSLAKLGDHVPSDHAADFISGLGGTRKVSPTCSAGCCLESSSFKRQETRACVATREQKELAM